MSLWRIALFVACSFFFSPQLIAQALPDLTSLNDESLIALLEKFEAAEEPDFCGNVSTVLEEMLRRETISGPKQEQKNRADFVCNVDKRNWKAAFQNLPAVEKYLGRDLGALGFRVALFSDQSVDAARRITDLVSAKDGREFRSLEDGTIFDLLNALWKGRHFSERGKMALAMVKSRHLKTMSDDIQTALADAIIEEEGRTGKFEHSVKMLQLLNSPFGFVDYLARRQYAPIWPQVERAAGTNLTKFTTKQVSKYRAKYTADPSNREAFQALAHTLLFAGKFEDVVAHVGSFDHSEAGIAKATENDAWALNVETYALDALGRRQEADAIFDRIAAIPYDPDRSGWLVSFAINRGSRLVELGQWEKGLQAALRAGEIAEKSGNPYSKMLIRRDKICALYNLGRAAEASALVEAVVEARKDSYTAAAIALLCSGAPDRAAQVTIEALSDPFYAPGIVNEMQKPEFRIFYTRSKLPTVRNLLISHPDVRTAFEKVAREIPDEYTPFAGKRRSELEAARR